MEITDDTVTAVAGRLSGGAGPGSTDSVSLQHWLLRLGAASAEFRRIVGDFVEWLGNGRPPWAVYRALMSGGGTGGGPGPAGTSNMTGGKDRGLAHGAAVHLEWYRAGVPGVASRPLTEVWAGSPGPPIAL